MVQLFIISSVMDEANLSVVCWSAEATVLLEPWTTKTVIILSSFHKKHRVTDCSIFLQHSIHMVSHVDKRDEVFSMSPVISRSPL